MKDNFQRPLWALLQPRASRKAKETLSLEDPYNGQPKVIALEVTRVKSNTILRRSVNPKKKGKVSKRPALQEGVPWEKEPPKRYEPVSKGNQPTCFAFKKRDCPKCNACNCCWLPPECCYHQKEGCTLWKMCVIKHAEQAGGETKKRSNSAEVSNTLDITQAGEEVTSLKSRTKGDLLHCFSGTPVTVYSAED